MTTQSAGQRAVGGWRKPVLAAGVTTLLTLGIGSGLLVGATVGLAKTYAAPGLLWLGTIGLPTSQGVAGVAALWGRFALLSGIGGFCVVAALIGFTLQVLCFTLVWQGLRSWKRPITVATWWRIAGAGTILLSLTTAGLWITQPRLADPVVVIDSHAHLFGHSSWPPIHNLGCGLSPSQRANASYGVLSRLLGLPKSGNLDEAYIQALITQVREAQRKAVDPSDPRFRAFYRQCAQGGVRILVHTGAEHSAPIASQRLGDPRLLDLALSEGCTVVAAHSATRAFFDPPAEDHFRSLVDMMRSQPRLYGDSAVLGCLARWRCLPDILSSPAVRPRTLHGSDWPFPANALVFWNRLHPLTLLDLVAEKNLFLRDLRLKQALGLPPESFTIAADVLGLGPGTTRVNGNSAKGYLR